MDKRAAFQAVIRKDCGFESRPPLQIITIGNITMTTLIKTSYMEVSLRAIAEDLQKRAQSKEYLNDAEFILLKKAWADLAISLVASSGKMDVEHQSQTKEDRYASAMKILG